MISFQFLLSLNYFLKDEVIVMCSKVFFFLFFIFTGVLQCCVSAVVFESFEVIFILYILIQYSSSFVLNFHFFNLVLNFILDSFLCYQHDLGGSSVHVLDLIMKESFWPKVNQVMEPSRQKTYLLLMDNVRRKLKHSLLVYDTKRAVSLNSFERCNIGKTLP